MEKLLKNSGKFFKGLRLQTLCLLITSTLLYASHAVIYELIPLDTVVVEYSQDNDQVIDPIDLNIIPLAKYLIYESFLFKLSTQFVAKCLIQTGFYIGVLIGLLLSWFIFNIFRPRLTLILSLTINSLLIFTNGFVPYYWTFVLLRLLVGITVGIGQTAIVILLFDWSHYSNHALIVHHQLGVRCVPLFIIALLHHYEFEWRRFFALHPCLIIITVLLDLIFINESPHWLRKHGKLEEFRRIYIRFASDLNVRTDDETIDVFSDDKEEVNPTETVQMPSPPETVHLVTCFILCTLASMILQGSSGFYLNWTTEICILASLTLLAYFVTMPLYSHQRVPLVVFITTSILLTTMLIFLPHGIMYGTLLQASKFNSILIDHFVFFFVINTCSPTTSDWRPLSLRIRTEWRKSLMLILNIFATIIKPIGVFFVLQKDDSLNKADRIPKLALCIACYGIGMFLIFAGYTFCSRRNLRKPADVEKPLIPVNPPTQPDDSTSPTLPDNETPDIIVSDEDDVDIDI